MVNPNGFNVSADLTPEGEGTVLTGQGSTEARAEQQKRSREVQKNREPYMEQAILIAKREHQTSQHW